ncbi:MAG: DTW domain-containing protein [Bacteriovorax sp.]|nr:DTW domain-containing protein [Bacteriovorax sp.]
MSKREVCPRCEYILARCLCHTLKPIDNTTQIIVLQHPSETGHALNTVHLMKKSFLKMDLFIGEDFSDHLELNSIIRDHKETIGLIFPGGNSTVLNSLSSKKITHLILIDGTWKKARKIYLLSKNLHQLQTHSLGPTKPGQYKIRSSTFEDGLSTLEATVCALGCVEKNLDTQSLEETFSKMIEFQIEKMGEETFRKNYKKENKKDE